MKDLLEKYKEYAKREFGDCSELEPKHILGLAYTTLENDEEVQVSYDLNEQKFIVDILTLTGHYIYKEKLSLDEFEEELENATFDMYYSYAHHVAEKEFGLDLEW